MGETPIFDQLVARWTSPTDAAPDTPRSALDRRGDQARHRSRILTFDPSRRPGTALDSDPA